MSDCVWKVHVNVNYVVVNSCEPHNWFTKQEVGIIFVVVMAARLTLQWKKMVVKTQLSNNGCDIFNTCTSHPGLR